MMNPSAHEGTWAVNCRIVAQLLGNAQPSELTNTATFTLRSGWSPIVSGQVVFYAGGAGGVTTSRLDIRIQE